MVPDDGQADRQAQPGPLADLLGGEERIEDAPRVLGRDAGAVVGDRDHDLVLLGLAADGQRPLAVRLEHRLLRVGDQVGEDVLQLVEVAQDERQLRVELGLHLDAADVEIVRLALDRLEDHAVQSQGLLFRFLAPREDQQVLDDAGRALGLPQDDVDPLGQLGLRVVLLHELRVPQHAAQGVVQLVRHPREEVAEGGHLLRLDDFLLGFLQPSHAGLQLVVQPRVAEGEGHQRGQDHGVAAIALGVALGDPHAVDVEDAQERAAHGERADDRSLDAAPRRDAAEAVVPAHVLVDHHRLGLHRHAAGDALAHRQVRVRQDLLLQRRGEGDVQRVLLVQEHERGVVGPQDLDGRLHDASVQLVRVEGREDRAAQLEQPQALPQVAPLQRLVDREEEVLQDHRLDQEVEGPLPQALDGALHRAVRGDDDDLDVGIDRLDLTQGFEAVDAGHAEVAERHVETGVAYLLDGRAAVLRRAHGVSPFAQGLAEQVAQGRLVVDDQDAGRVGLGGRLEGGRHRGTVRSRRVEAIRAWPDRCGRSASGPIPPRRCRASAERSPAGSAAPPPRARSSP